MSEPGSSDAKAFHEEELLDLEDADGNTRTFALIAVVEVDGQNFAMLTPRDAVSDSEGALEVALFAYEEDEEGAIYSDIEDEALFDRVQTFCFALLRDEV